MKRCLVLILFVLIPYFTFSEQRVAHLTFVDSNPSLESNDVVLKMEDLEIPVQALTQVDTGQRSPELLFHPAGRRLYLFLLDMVFSSSQELLQAKKTIESFLPELEEGDLLALAVVTPDDGLKFLCSPTLDRDKILLGLNTLGKKKVSGMIQGADGNLYPDDFPPHGLSFDSVTDEEFLERVKGYQVKEKQRKESRPILLQALVDLGHALSVLQGRKNVLFFTEGIDAGGLSVVIPLREKPVRTATGSSSATTEPDTLETITDATWQRNRARSGADAPFRPRRRSGTDILPEFLAGSDSHFFIVHSGTKVHGIEKKLVERTNGELLESGTDITSFLEKVLESDRTYYVLTCLPEVDQLIDLNSVELEVKGKKIEDPVRWLIPRDPVEYTPLDKMVKVAETLYKEADPPPAIFRFWSDFIPEKGLIKVSNILQIEGPPLLEADVSYLNFEFFAFSESDSMVQDSAYLPFSLNLKNRNLKEKLEKSGVKIWNVLLGEQQLSGVRWVIIDPIANKVYSHSIPAPDVGETLVMTTPFFPATNLDWVVWPNPMETHNKRGVQISYPYKAGADLLFFPDLTPKLRIAAAGQVLYLRIYNQATQAKTPAVRLSLHNESGLVSEIPVLGLLEKPHQISSHGLGLFWRLSTVPKVDPGDYRLSVTAIDPAAGTEVARELQLKVVPGS